MMKTKLASISLLLIISHIFTTNVSANYYAGNQLDDAYGVASHISAPSGLILVEVDQSGEANWVSTYDHDDSGTDWLQTGWKYFYGYSVPKQYVEWCIDCIGQQGTYQIHDTFSNHIWGTTIDYKVQRVDSTQWCAYTGGYLRYCVNNLHDNPVMVMVKSEIFETSFNPVDTYYDQSRYLDPIDNTWKLLDSGITWHIDFPYNLEVFSSYNFHTYRTNTIEIYMPMIIG